MVYEAIWFKSPSFIGFLIGCIAVFVLCLMGFFFHSLAMIAPVCVFAVYVIRTFKECLSLEVGKEHLILRNYILPRLKTEIAVNEIKTFLLFSAPKGGTLILYVTTRDGSKRKKYVLGCVPSAALHSLQKTLNDRVKG